MFIYWNNYFGLASNFITFSAEKIAEGIPRGKDQFTGKPLHRTSSFGALLGLLASPQITHLLLQYRKRFKLRLPWGSRLELISDGATGKILQTWSGVSEQTRTPRKI